MKKIVVVLIVAGIVIGVIGYKSIRGAKITWGPEVNFQKPDFIKSSKEARETMATVVPAQKPDFITDGNLRLKSTGEETENWTLLYEEPGKPAIIIYLTFNFRSKCDYGSGEQICNTKKFENGLRVHVEGTKNGNDVTVIKLKVI